MIRVVFFLILTGILALAAGWLADRPGDVEIVWLDYRITTSVAVLTSAVLFLMALSIVLWSLARGLIRSPGSFKNYLQIRRLAKGQRAIVRGLIAVGAGDSRAAIKFAGDAQRLVADEPLALLLGAQAAQLAGDRDAAERTFGLMAARKDMKLLGLHGLFIEARRREDMPGARVLAEEAARTDPSLAWAGRAVLEFRCASGDWAGALDALDNAMASSLIDKPSFRRQRAVLLTAQAQDLIDKDRDRAKPLVLEAVKLAPDLVPAAALAGRFFIDAGDVRKAARVLETAWRAQPHPDLAEAYMNVRPSDSARERFVRVQKLEKLSPGNVESALAMARAAIDAQAFAAARTALTPLLVAPTQRVAMLMAELEEVEHGDIGRARQWMARAVHAPRDPAWTADGFVSEHWTAVSPSGRLDAFEWKVPVAELPGAVIEADLPEPDAVEPVVAEAHAEAAAEPPAAAGASVPAPRAAAVYVASQVVDAVIPLVHAPDDPGPEFEAEHEPAPEPKQDGWRRLRSLFG